MRDSRYRSTAGVALAAALILVAVGVLRGESDPDVMSLWVLPLIIIGAIAYTATNTHSTAYRWAVGVALAAAFILFWMIGGVGVLGPDDEHPADLMYIGVLAVGIIGAIIALPATWNGTRVVRDGARPNVGPRDRPDRRDAPVPD